MSEPSLPQGSPELPRTFSFTLPFAEVVAVRDYADRYAPVPGFEYCILLTFLPGKHQWFMNEMNVMAWFEYDGNGPSAGTLVVSVQQLNLMVAMCSDSEDVAVHIDLDAKQFCYEADGVVVSVDIARQFHRDWTSTFAAAWSVRAETNHLVKLGRAMMSHPVNLPIEGLEEVPLPFIDFSFDGATLNAVRDWSRFGGPRVTVDIPASGAYRGEFSCLAEPLARELFYADMSEGDELTLAFSVDIPNFAHLTGDRWGIKVGLGHHFVYEHRFAVVRNLLANDIEVEEDSRIGWDPVVRCTHRNHEVSATILCDENNEAHFVRLSCIVVANAPWNLQMAEEMNSWNNMWANSKLVREGDSLHVIADVSVTSLEVLAESVRNLVMKANNVSDVVAVFM
jgi:hypothetical protein